jgi:hypothetical protein
VVDPPPTTRNFAADAGTEEPARPTATMTVNNHLIDRLIFSTSLLAIKNLPFSTTLVNSKKSLKTT